MLMLATLPIHRQPGDARTRTGNRLTIRRGNVVVFEGNLWPLSEPIKDDLLCESVQSNQIVWEPVVSTLTTVITDVERLAGQGSNGQDKWIVTWDNSFTLEFNSWEDLVAFGSEIVQDPLFARKLGVATLTARSPDGTGIASLKGTKVSIAPNAFNNEATVETPE